MKHTGGTVGAVDPERVEDAVVRLVGALAPAPLARARPEQSMIGDLGYHSLRLIELAFAFEDLFATIGETEPNLPLIGTVRDLVDYVTERLMLGHGTMPTREAVDEFIAGL
jgi:acyl carrier protein